MSHTRSCPHDCEACKTPKGKFNLSYHTNDMTNRCVVCGQLLNMPGAMIDLICARSLSEDERTEFINLLNGGHDA